MGSSATAILFYGYVWQDEGSSIFTVARHRGDEEEDEDEDPDECEWSEQVALKRGHQDPWMLLKRGEVQGVEQRYNSFGTETYMAPPSDLLDAWYAVKKAIEGEFGVDVVFHGCDSSRHFGLAIAGTEVKVDWGEYHRIEALTVDPTWASMLKRWLDELDLVPPEGQEPGWWMVAEYG